MLFDLEFVFLNVDDQGKKLFFETSFCDDEVDDGTLGCDLWSEVRVGEFSHEIELELRVIVDDLCTQL